MIDSRSAGLVPLACMALAISSANPLQAALTSALTFAVGALLPLLVAFFTPLAWIVPGSLGAPLTVSLISYSAAMTAVYLLLFVLIRRAARTPRASA